MNGYRCDVCGKFISYADLDSGVATHSMVEPDSILSRESWKNLCRVCKPLAIAEVQGQEESAEHDGPEAG